MSTLKIDDQYFEEYDIYKHDILGAYHYNYSTDRPLYTCKKTNKSISSILINIPENRRYQIQTANTFNKYFMIYLLAHHIGEYKHIDVKETIKKVLGELKECQST